MQEKSENKSHLSANLLFLRETKEWTQAKMGEMFGLSRDNIASYERGADPKIRILWKISAYFNLTLDEIVKKDLTKEMCDFKSQSNPPNQTTISTPEPTPQIKSTQENEELEEKKYVIKLQKQRIQELEEKIKAYETAKQTPQRSMAYTTNQ